MLTAVYVMLGLALVLGILLGYSALKFKVEGDPLVARIDAILPQTQCGQCGFPGCKPMQQRLLRARPILTNVHQAVMLAPAHWLI